MCFMFYEFLCSVGQVADSAELYLTVFFVQPGQVAISEAEISNGVKFMTKLFNSSEKAIR